MRMSLENAKLWILVVGLTLASGFLDSRGFIYSANIWKFGSPALSETLKTFGAFVAGISLYCIALKYLGRLGVRAPEIQAIIWFGVTMIGISVSSRRFLRWVATDQVIAIFVLVGIGWLVFRTSELPK